MPTVVRVDGFQVRIFPNDHPPTHVHVYKAGTAVVLELGTGGDEPSIRSVAGMSDADVVKAFWIVEARQEFLWTKWEELHG